MPSGALVIDTPGMREFQMWLADQGIHEAFPEIEALGAGCRFRDCSHTGEKGCAVLAAVSNGELPESRYQSFLKLRKELQFMEQAHTRHGYLQRKRQTRVAQRAFDQLKRGQFTVGE
jgi:ribosome biogenesis GTPase